MGTAKNQLFTMFIVRYSGYSHGKNDDLSQKKLTHGTDEPTHHHDDPKIQGELYAVNPADLAECEAGPRGCFPPDMSYVSLFVQISRFYMAKKLGIVSKHGISTNRNRNINLYHKG